MAIIFNSDPSTYSAWDGSGSALLPVYIIVIIITTYMIIIMYRRWKERGSKTAKYLLYSFFTFLISEIFILTGFLEMYLTGYKKILYRLSLTGGYTGIMIGNCFLILFASYIFDGEEIDPSTKKKLILSTIIAILVALPFNYYGYIEENTPIYGSAFRLITSLIMMLFSLYIYSKIFLKAYNFSKRMDEIWAKKGFQFIAYSQLSLIFFFVFTLLDTIWFSFTDSRGYTIFIYFAWIMVIFFLLFSYIGFVMPEWFKKRFLGEKKN